MKLIKIIMVVVMSFGMMIAQGQGQGQGPDPFQQAFMTTMQNGGTPDVAFEAVAAVFHKMEVECPDCEMSEEEFQEGKAEAKAAFDAVLADGGTPEEAFHAAMETHGDQGPPTCDVCGYTFTGEGDHHGHCDKCDFVFTSDNDQHGHCDQCDYIFDGEGDRHGHCDKCDHIYSGDDDRHGHCRVCDAEMNTDEDWRGHCDANPDHCRPQAGDTCGYRHDGGEACDYVFTDDEGEDHHHCDACGAAVSSGQEMDQHCQDNPEHCRPRAGDTCECGFTFAGTDADENHRHCPTCKAQFDNDGDMGQHCQDNEGHCGDNNDQN